MPKDLKALLVIQVRKALKDQWDHKVQDHRALKVVKDLVDLQDHRVHRDFKDLKAH